MNLKLLSACAVQHGALLMYLLLGLAAACGQTTNPVVAPANTSMPGNRGVPPATIPASGIENFFKLTERVYSGSQPHGEDAFATLKKLGVTTLISVDGAKPDVAEAARFGLRYVHIPVGYDGISASNAWLLARAVQVSPGPVFVHCHHGKHRGPAAAALACQGIEGWSPTQGLGWMKTAGTATNYTGLWRSVREYHPPTPEELKRLPAELPAQARVSHLAEAMVRVDHAWDNLKAIRAAGFKAPNNQPDLSPANESLMLWEALRESRRLEGIDQRGEKFLVELAKAENAARNLHEQLKSTPISGAEAAFQAVAGTCSACHKAHRD